MSVTTQDLWKCIHGDEESPHTWTGAGVFWLLPVSLSCDGFVVFRLWRGGNRGSEEVESFNKDHEFLTDITLPEAKTDTMLWVLIIGVLWRVLVHMLYSDSYLERKFDYRLLIIDMLFVVLRLIPGSILWSVYCQQWFLLTSKRLWWNENMIWKVYFFHYLYHIYWRTSLRGSQGRRSACL